MPLYLMHIVVHKIEHHILNFFLKPKKVWEPPALGKIAQPPQLNAKISFYSVLGVFLVGESILVGFKRFRNFLDFLYPKITSGINAIQQRIGISLD